MDMTRRLLVTGSVVPAIGAAGVIRAQERGGTTGRAGVELPDMAALRSYAQPEPGSVPQPMATQGLRAEQQVVHLRGYHRAGDGGGGEFLWDPDGRDDDDGGTIIRPNGQGEAGRWRRLDVAMIDARWFGAKADGTGEDDAPSINAALRAAAKANVALVLSGEFRLAHSLVLPAPVTIVAAATLIAGEGDYNSIPYWTGNPSGRSCLIDLAFGRFSTVSGRVVVRAANPERPPAGLAAIGSSQGLYIELLPNADGRGGSNTSWQSIEIHDLDHGFFSPERGAPVPTGLAPRDAPFAKADWQPSAVARGDGSYLALRYLVGDHVLSGRAVYVCTAAGTPTTGPVIPGNGEAAGDAGSPNWEFVTDEQVPGVRRWTDETAVAAGELVVTETGTYRARQAGPGGGRQPDQHGAERMEAAPPPWRAGEAPELLSFRQSHGGFYRLVAAGKSATVGDGPGHRDDRPQADADGWSWAYAGPATPPTWRYVRKPNYCAAGVGMVIDHFWAEGVGCPWTSSATATDDSFIGHFRAQGCRDTAIRINGGQFTAATVFIHGMRGRFADGDPQDHGAAAIQNFGSYQAGSTYIAGEWARGLVLGQGSQTETTFKADGDFKTSTGVAIEAHPAATRLEARIRSAAYNAVQPVGDFLYVDGKGFAAGGTLTGPQGKTLILGTQQVSADRVLIIHRPLAGAIQPGDAVTDGRSQGRVSADGDRRRNTLSTGLIGIPRVAGAAVTRQIDLTMPVSQSQMRPFRELGAALGPDYRSQDRLMVRATDGSALYRYRAGTLVRSDEAGYVDLGQVSGIVDINPLDGATQLVTIASPEAQIRLPATVDGGADAVKRGGHLQLEIVNPGVARTLFFSGPGHPPPIFTGGAPLWPRSGRSVVHLWLYNGMPWRAAVAGACRRIHSVTVGELGTGATASGIPPARGDARYLGREFSAGRGDGGAAWFWWHPPAGWNRGPIRYRYRWARPEGPGTGVACVLQGAVILDGMSLAADLGPEIALADEGEVADSLYVSDESSDVPLPGADKWSPGAAVQFRFARNPSGGVGAALSVSMYLLGIDILFDEG